MTDAGVVNIRGKQYQTVALRIQQFWKLHPDWSLITENVQTTVEVVVFSCRALDETGRVRANGHAEEKWKSSQINKTSAVENCETSAVGRCLANLGLGGDYAIASAEELQNALHQQASNDTTIDPPAAFDVKDAVNRLANVQEFGDLVDWYVDTKARAKTSDLLILSGAFTARCNELGLDRAAVQEAAR